MLVLFISSKVNTNKVLTAHNTIYTVAISITFSVLLFNTSFVDNSKKKLGTFMNSINIKVQNTIIKYALSEIAHQADGVFH